MSSIGALYRKRWLRNVLWAAILLLAGVSVLPGFLPGIWWMDNFSHFPPQFLVTALVLEVLSIGIPKRRGLAILILTFTAVWNVRALYPFYAGGAQRSPAKEDSFRLASINLLNGNHEYGRVSEYIQETNPDILVLMEYTPYWHKELAYLQREYPYGERHPQPGSFGMALLSRFPLEAQLERLTPDGEVSLSGVIQYNGEAVSIIATHPQPPMDADRFRRRNAQLEALGRRIRSTDGPLILAGDLNTSSFSPHFKEFVGGKLKDTRHGFGIQLSWPSFAKPLMTTLDHCLISRELEAVDRVTGPGIGSDHLPIWVDLTVSTGN